MQQAFFATKNGTLYMGDCLDVLPEIPDGSVDMVLCDLPYGTTSFKWDKKLPFGRLWAEYSRLIREHGAIALTAQQPFATDLIVTGRKLFRYELIWEKTLACGFLNANRMPLRAHENILIFYKKGGGDGSVYGRTYRIQEHRNTGQRYPRSVLRFANVNARNHGHPTEKPLELFEWLIRTYTNEGDLVLDNCLGSGTTAVAAERQNRRWLGIEKELEYCEIAKRRLEELGNTNGS